VEEAQQEERTAEREREQKQVKGWKAAMQPDQASGSEQESA
jgi:hypothetical protein